MVTSIYKIISKVLANQLKSIFHKVIDPWCIYSERHIHDRVLVANECREDYRSININGIVVKLYIEEASDKISWEILDYASARKGFPPK